MSVRKNEMEPVDIQRPCLAFYHPNGKGTGSACMFRLHPATEEDDGSIEMKVANQLTVPSLVDGKTAFPTFDWDNAIDVSLEFSHICNILQVLRGECETIKDGSGLYIIDRGEKISLKMTHYVEMTNGYMLDVVRRDGDNESRVRFMFTPSESLGLCESISGALYLVAFGMPSVCAHT